jgi:hypothetical protein
MDGELLWLAGLEYVFLGSDPRCTSFDSLSTIASNSP